jgi:membrane protein
VSDYLAIVVVAPVFLLLGMTATTFLEGTFAARGEIPIGFGGAGLRLLPLIAVWFGLSFVYLTLPNTRVRISSALIGGLVAGTIWQGIQVLHVAGQIHLARFNTIYASFAAIPMLLLWIYLSWSVFLVGAELAFAHQNEPAFTSMARTGKVDQTFRERIAPRLAGRITRAFLQGKPAPSSAELAAELGVAPRTVAQVLEVLCAADLLAPTSVGVDDGYLPARDPETITVLHLLTALRHEEGATTPPARDKLDERSDRILAALDEECRRSLHNYTLRELASTREEADPVAPERSSAARAAETSS